MSKIETNSLFEASIDSFRYKIPLESIDVINMNVLDEMINVKINASTGEILKQTRTSNGWIEIAKDGYEIGFSKGDIFGTEYALIKISSKLLEHRYLEGITMKNIELIYKNIMSCKVFEMSFEQFLSEGILTDIDIKKDVEISRDDFKKGIKELAKHSRPRKNKKHGVNTFSSRNNVGVEWNDRATANAENPFLKIYDKELESRYKDSLQIKKGETPFFDTYVNADELKNRVRMEATIKNLTTAKKHEIESLTLMDVLKLTPTKLNQVIVDTLNANVERRTPKARMPKDEQITPQDLLNYILLNNLIEHQGYDIDTALEYVLNHFKDKVAKSRTKSKLMDVYSRHIEINKYARTNTRLRSFFDALGWA